MIKNNNFGFTIIETLLVLCIFLILTSTTLILIKPHYRFLQQELFFSQLKSDLYYAQQFSITSQKTVDVYLFPTENRYLIKVGFSGPIIIDRFYSENIKISNNTLGLNFQFKPDGNVSKFGSIYIDIEKNRYKFTIQIGRGRFYVAKE